MTREDYLFLESLARHEYGNFAQLDPFQRERFCRFERMGYIRSRLGGSFDVLPAGHDALQDHLRTASEMETETLRARLVLAAQQQTAAGVEAVSSELASLRSELEQTRNEFADFKRQQAEQHAADMAQAELDLKKLHRHDFLVALFSALFTLAATLIAQHSADLLDLLKAGYEFVVALFK